MKILYILPGKYFISKAGGCISHVTGVIDALKEEGHEIIFCSSDKIPYYSSRLEYKLLKVNQYKIKKIGSLYEHYIVYKQIRNVIRDVNPDIIYIRWRQNFFWSKLFKGRKYRLIFECNTPPSMALLKDDRGNIVRSLVSKYLDRQICLNTDIISAISTEVKSFIINNISAVNEKIIVNPNGVNPKKFKSEGKNCRGKLNISKNDIVIGYSGNIEDWHGVDTLINAFQLLDKNKYSNIKLLIIGSGDKFYLEKLYGIARKKYSKDIIFTGIVPYNEMPAYLRTCDILVSPQKPYIGGELHQSPIKLYEYMATERAIIASNIGQIKRVIKNNFNGLLFESGNEYELANNIKLLLDNEILRNKIAGNARIEAVTRYSWKNNVKRFLNAVERS